MTEKLKIDLSLLSKYRTELMGFSAIGILMCHAYGYNVIMPTYLWQICSLGQTGVSIFFLLSGMGMFYSLKKSEQDTQHEGSSGLIHWYQARYIKLFVPYLLMAIPYFLWRSFENNTGLMGFLKSITTLTYWIDGGAPWFVGAIIPLYLIVPWWHKLLCKMRHSLIPTLLVFMVLLCLGQWRHMDEIAFFFLGYWLGKPVFEGRTINAIVWIVIPILLYITCRFISYLDWIPRSLLLVVPFLLLAACIFDKADQHIKKPFQFMGKISLESYLANTMLPDVFACVPWIINGVNYNVGNRLLYLCVVVFGILTAFGVHYLAQPIINKLLASTKIKHL